MKFACVVVICPAEGHTMSDIKTAFQTERAAPLARRLSQLVIRMERG